MSDDEQVSTDSEVSNESTNDSPPEQNVEEVSSEDTQVNESDNQPQDDESSETASEESEATGKDDESEPSDADKKAHNKKMYEQRVKSRTDKEIADTIDRNFGPSSEQDLLDQGYGDTEARIEAKIQELDFARAKDRLVRLNSDMQRDAERVYKDFPVFNPESKEYDADFAKKVEDRYQRVARLRIENVGENGTDKIITNAEEPLYKFYEEAAEFYAKGSNRGVDQGQKNAVKMMSRAQKPASNSEPKSSDKPIDQMNSAELEAHMRKQGKFIKA